VSPGLQWLGLAGPTASGKPELALALARRWPKVMTVEYNRLLQEAEQGLPYLIWQVLPEMFPKYLPGPGGYASLGLVWEPGHERLEA